MSKEAAVTCPDCGEVLIPAMILTGDEDFGMLAADRCEAADQHVCHSDELLDAEIDRASKACIDEHEMVMLRDILPDGDYSDMGVGELPF
jgi:hypothetical protein